MPDEMSDEEFARAFAPLLEVLQRGQMRAATPDDVLEMLGVGGPRYVLKDQAGRYITDDGSHWTRRQRAAVVIPDRATARALRAEGRRHGVETRIVRIRRRGTSGIEGMRLRPDLEVTLADGRIEMAIKPEDVMAILAARLGAKPGDGVQ